MTKINQKNTSTGSAPTVEANGNPTNVKSAASNERSEVETVAEVVSNIAELPAPKTTSKGQSLTVKPTLLDQISEERRANAEKKMELLGEARQQLALAADLYKEGAGKAKEAGETADKASHRLYQLRANGSLTVEEVNGILGDNFGYKTSPAQAAAGKTGKTPDGQGEVIRKRLVRSVAAAMFVQNDDADYPGKSFFDGMTPDTADDDGNTVEEVVAALEEGNITLFTAYDTLAKIKKANTVRLATALNPKSILAIVAGLAPAEAIKFARENKELASAYSLLRDVLAIVYSVDEPEALAA